VCARRDSEEAEEEAGREKFKFFPLLYAKYTAHSTIFRSFLMKEHQFREISEILFFYGFMEAP
jgi:hypothetical protein